MVGDQYEISKVVNDPHDNLRRHWVSVGTSRLVLSTFFAQFLATTVQ